MWLITDKVVVFAEDNRRNEHAYKYGKVSALLAIRRQTSVKRREFCRSQQFQASVSSHTVRDNVQIRLSIVEKHPTKTCCSQRGKDRSAADKSYYSRNTSEEMKRGPCGPLLPIARKSLIAHISIHSLGETLPAFSSDYDLTYIKHEGTVSIKIYSCEIKYSEMTIVSDTNIILSGFINSGPPANILYLVNHKNVVNATSLAMLSELERILQYNRIRKILHQARVDPAVILQWVVNHSTVAEAYDIPDQPIPSDPDDHKILACAIKSHATVVISGDHHLLRLREYRGVPIVSARIFLERRR